MQGMTIQVHKGLSALEATGYIPSYERRYWFGHRRALSSERFAYDAASGRYTCLHAKALHFTYVNTAKRKKDHARRSLTAKRVPFGILVSPHAHKIILLHPLTHLIQEGHLSHVC
jgi:hypothetical protein